MSTKIRANISIDNRYYISKHRYYELKHFCLQYPEWKKQYTANSYISSASIMSIKRASTFDRTAEIAIENLQYINNMRLVERIVSETDKAIAPYILKGVTEGYSYVYLKAALDIPCSKGFYYDRYRRFFWLLSKER